MIHQVVLNKPLLGALANGLTVLAYLPYLRSIFLGRTRPHVFSWIIWGLATGIAFLAVLQARGGAGAWPIGFSCLVSFLVAGLAYLKRADISITRSDWLMFWAALAAIPVWMAANDPLWAVVLITFIELLGFGPTFRKSWSRPHSESISFLVILMVRNAIIIAALDQHSLTTVLFPAAAALACGLLVALLLVRRPRIAR
ncbi:MAG: hypothetical protein AB1899_05450 [Pseudomonadota bacterium]